MRQELLTAQQVLKQFNDAHPAMSVGQALQAVTIALNEGATMTEIASKSGVSLPSLSRNQRVFRAKRRRDGSGAVLEEAWITIEPDPLDERHKIMKLTEAGTTFFEKLAKTIGKVIKEDPLRGMIKNILKEIE